MPIIWNHAGGTLFKRVVAYIMEPLQLLIVLLNTISWIIGALFIGGAVFRYLQYRDNPSQSPISQAFFLAALGIVLLLLPFVARYAMPMY
jgi:hypothetical protein